MLKLNKGHAQLIELISIYSAPGPNLSLCSENS